MQLGYLGKDGALVSVDTLGARAAYKSYRLVGPKPSLEFLGKPRPMEAIGTVAVTVELHRVGWSEPGEVVLRRSTATLYRTRTSHLLVGSGFRALRVLRVLTADPVAPAFLSSGPQPRDGDALLRDSYPPPSARWIVMLPDAAVKGCHQHASVVEMYATEQRHFTDFVMSKVRVILEFPSDQSASTFASGFVTVQDVRQLDSSVQVAVDRSPGVDRTPRVRRRIAGFGVLFGVGFLPGIALAAAVASPSSVIVGGILTALLEVGTAAAFMEARKSWRREVRDLEEKWPGALYQRWCREAILRGHVMPEVLRELGVDLNPIGGNLEPLDRFLRGLPANTFFGALALDLAAYVGDVLLARIGRETDAEWTINPVDGRPVLRFPSIEQWVSPLFLVRQVWEQKAPGLLDELVAEWAEQVQLRLAFGSIADFSAAGFLSTGWDEFAEFEERFKVDLENTTATSYIVGEDHFRLRRVTYGGFGVELYEVEVETPRGPSFAPAIALPFARTTQRVYGRLEGAGAGPVSKAPGAREDLALVRFEGAELIPLGVQVGNYAELGPSFSGREGRIEIELLALADQAQVVGPRMRQLRAEAKDSIAPLHPAPDGIPASPYASFIGRITSVGEDANPFNGTPFWRIGLDISGFDLEVLVRKDRCDGLPGLGHHLTGSTWLLGRLGPESLADAVYIR